MYENERSQPTVPTCHAFAINSMEYCHIVEYVCTGIGKSVLHNKQKHCKHSQFSAKPMSETCSFIYLTAFSIPIS